MWASLSNRYNAPRTRNSLDKYDDALEPAKTHVDKAECPFDAAPWLVTSVALNKFRLDEVRRRKREDAAMMKQPHRHDNDNDNDDDKDDDDDHGGAPAARAVRPRRDDDDGAGHGGGASAAARAAAAPPVRTVFLDASSSSDTD